jgi:hypothetical protein
VVNWTVSTRYINSLRVQGDKTVGDIPIYGENGTSSDFHHTHLILIPFGNQNKEETITSFTAHTPEYTTAVLTEIKGPAIS